MAKAGQDRPVKAVESPETGDLTLDEAKVELANLRQQNEFLRGLLKGLTVDLMTLRDICNRALG